MGAQDAPDLDAVLGPALRRAKLRDLAEVNEIERRILATCTDVQRDFVLDPHRWLALKTPRRSGKTEAVLRKMVRTLSRRRGVEARYIALSRPHAKDLLWQPLREFADQQELLVGWNETDLSMTLRATGSVLRLIGADDKREVEKRRGGKKAAVAIDEAASFPTKLLKYMIHEAIGPSLVDLNGWLAMVGTPSTILAGEFYEATRVGTEVSRPWAQRDTEEWRDRFCTCDASDECEAFGWTFHEWTVADNNATEETRAIWTRALALKKRNGWSDDNPIWQREWLGRWIADDTGKVYRYQKYKDGKPWNTWGPENWKQLRLKQILAHLPKGHEWRFVFGIDQGSKDPWALQVFAYADTHPNLYQVWEYQKRGLIVSHQAAVLKTVISEIGSYPDGMVADLAGLGGNIIDTLAAEHGLSIEAAEKRNKLDAIEDFNSDLFEGRIKVLPGSNLEQELLTLQWEDDPEAPTLREAKGQANHNADAAIYARRSALHHYAVEPEIEPERTPKQAMEDLIERREKATRRKAHQRMGEDLEQPDDIGGAGGEWGMDWSQWDP